MKLQNQYDSRNIQVQNRLFYPCPRLPPSNDSEIFSFFLKDLTFQEMREPLRHLTNEQTEKLRQIIDIVYKRYQNKELRVAEVGGIWPLLSCAFARSGLELYLHFEDLMIPIKELPLIPNEPVVKVELDEAFNPRGYFQNNEWKYHKKFIAQLRTLEAKATREDCLRIIRMLETEYQDLAQFENEFTARFIAFKNKLIREKKSKEIVENTMNFNSAFGLRMFKQEQNQPYEHFVLSEPDILQSTFTAFTKKQYDNIHECKSLRIPHPIREESEHSEQSDRDIEIHSKRQSTTVKAKQISLGKLSSPTKRRLPQQASHRNTAKKREVRRPPRNIMVARLFQLETNKNILLEDFRKTKKNEQKQRKRKHRLDRIQKRIRYSDGEQSTAGRKKQSFIVDDFIESQSDPQSRYSHIQHRNTVDRQLYLQESQEIVMKRRRNQHKKPQRFNHFFEEQSSHQSQHPRTVEQSIEIEEEEQIINVKQDKSAIGKMSVGTQNVKTKQKLQNIDIRRLNLDDKYHLRGSIDFNRYQHYLCHLHPKEIHKQVHKIIKEAVSRQHISFDIDLTFKVIAAWTMASLAPQPHQPTWSHLLQLHISPLLKHILAANCYRTITEVLNNFFVSAYNEDLGELNRARQYFKLLLFEVGQSFTKLKLDEELIKIFYDAMLTPKRLNNLITNPPFFPESQINLPHPFKIGTAELKFSLSDNEDKIAFVVGSLVMEALLLERKGDKTERAERDEFLKSKQKEFLVSLKGELNVNLPATWYYSLVETVKKFYTSYKPSLRNDYFMVLMGIINLSLNKLIIESITAENDVETKKQVQFLLQVMSDYVKMKASQGLPDIISFVSELIMASGVNGILKNQKSIISYMAYSSVLRLLWELLIPLPFKADRKQQVIDIVFIKYLKQFLEPDFSKIISPLKPNIYLPVIQLISHLYHYYLSQTHPQNASELSKITSVMEKLWENLDKKHDDFTRLMEYQLKQVNPHQSKENSGDIYNQIDSINAKLERCESGMKHFLRHFILPEGNQDNNSLSDSQSHFFFGLEFVLKQNCFIKYLGRRYQQVKTSQFQCILLDILRCWFSSPNKFQQKRLEQRYYERIVLYYQGSGKRQRELNLLAQTSDKGIQQKFAMIYGVQLIAALRSPKLIAPPQNNIIKLIEKSVSPYLSGFNNIVKAVNCFNLLLERLMAYIYERQSDIKYEEKTQISRIKQYFWEHLICKSAKDIVTLIFLANAAQNVYQYQSIPVGSIVTNLKKIMVVKAEQLPSRDSGYHFFLFCLQKTASFASITDVFTEMARQTRPIALDKIESMLKDIFIPLRKLQQVQYNKQPMVIQSIRILCFIIAFQQPPADLIKAYLKDMQLVSNADSLIARLKINDSNVKLLLTFFELTKKMKDNPHHIKEAITSYIDKITPDASLLPTDKKNEHFKQIKKLLDTIRSCVANQIRLNTVAILFLKQLLQRFCSPKVLKSSQSQVRAQKLAIFVEMMKNSFHQRRAYESMFIDNWKQFKQIIAGFEGIIETSMIGPHSDLLDIKRLLGTMSKSSKIQLSVNPSKKQVYCKLFQKLKHMASCTNVAYMDEWCEQQINEIQRVDLFEDFMDIEQ